MLRPPLPALVLAAALATTALAACTPGAPRRVEVGGPGPAPSAGAATAETVPPDAPPAQSPVPATDPLPPPPADEGPPVVLREDGLGEGLRFGAKPDHVIAGLTLRWGPPEADTGWLPADGPPQPFGQNCPGSQVRGVSWGGFFVLFSDGPTPHGPAGRPHFFSWVYLAGSSADPQPDPGGNRPPLGTAAGISVAATVPGLRAAYGDRLNLYDETTEEGLATGGPGFAADGIFGALTDLGESGRVSRLVGGGGCDAEGGTAGGAGAPPAQR